MLVNCTHQFTNRLIRNATRSFGVRHYSRENDFFSISIPIDAEIISFADDTAVLFKNTNWDLLKLKVERDFQYLLDFFNYKLLTVNVGKTLYLPFSSDANCLPQYKAIKVSYADTVVDLKSSNSIKYLGIIIDNHLHWNLHINSIIKKLKSLIPIFEYLTHFGSEAFKNDVLCFGSATFGVWYRWMGRSNSQAATPQPMSVPFFKEHENEFMGYLPAVLKSLTENKENSDLASTTERLTKLLEYNLPIGDKVKGVTTVVSYKMLEISKNITEENVKLANILGWCAELLEAANMVAEDIINNSETRRNAPCWFRLPHVGNAAYLDPFDIETCIFNLLRKYFSKHVHYTAMITFFHTAFNKNAAGRIIDYQKRNIDQLNMDTFHRITQYKYGYDAFYVGFTLGMFISRIYDNALHKQVTPILMDMGKYVKIQKDVQDCLSNTITGNVGTNIAEGRCNWLVTTALEKSDPLQTEIIEENYGRKEDEAIQTILNLYKTLDIAAEFRTYEEDSYITLCVNIDEIANIRISKLLRLIVKQLYNR